MTSMDDLRRSIGDDAQGTGATMERKKELGEGAGGMVVGITVLLSVVAFVLAVLLIPGLLDWMIAIGLWLVILLLVFTILIGLVIAVVTVGVGIFYLSKPTEYQGPEVSYTLDMVKEPPKGSG